MTHSTGKLKNNFLLRVGYPVVGTHLKERCPRICVSPLTRVAQSCAVISIRVVLSHLDNDIYYDDKSGHVYTAKRDGAGLLPRLLLRHNHNLPVCIPTLICRRYFIQQQLVLVGQESRVSCSRKWVSLQMKVCTLARSRTHAPEIVVLYKQPLYRIYCVDVFFNNITWHRCRHELCTFVCNCVITPVGNRSRQYKLNTDVQHPHVFNDLRNKSFVLFNKIIKIYILLIYLRLSLLSGQLLHLQ